MTGGGHARIAANWRLIELVALVIGGVFVYALARSFAGIPDTVAAVSLTFWLTLAVPVTCWVTGRTAAWLGGQLAFRLSLAIGVMASLTLAHQMGLGVAAHLELAAAVLRVTDSVWLVTTAVVLGVGGCLVRAFARTAEFEDDLGLSAYLGTLAALALVPIAAALLGIVSLEAGAATGLLIGPMWLAGAFGVRAAGEVRLVLAATGAILSLPGLYWVVWPHVFAVLAGTATGRARFQAAGDLSVGLLAATASVVAIGGVLVRLGYRGDDGFRRPWNGDLGDARWLPMRDARRLFPATGDVVVGEAYRPDVGRPKGQEFNPADRRTWGRGGAAPILAYAMDFDSTHMLFFAGSGGFKTTSTVIPTALRYSGSMVVLDPAQEIGDQVGPVRRRMQGPRGAPRRVLILDPEDEASAGCDALVMLKQARNKQLLVGSYATMLLTEKPKAQSGGDAFFEGTTFGLMQGLLMYILACPFAHIAPYGGQQTEPTLRHLRALVALPEQNLRHLIGKIVHADERSDRIGYIADKDDRRFVVENLAAFVSMAPQSWSGIAATVASDTKWLSTEAFCTMVSRLPPRDWRNHETETAETRAERRLTWEAASARCFDLRDLPKGNTDVFVQIKGEVLKANPGVVRVLLGGMFKALMEAREELNDTDDGQRTKASKPAAKRPVLFCLDEVDLLGYMSALEEARDRGRKFGISLMLLYQSVGQIEKHFGKESAAAWFDSAALVSFAAIKSPETAERVSKAVGEATVLIRGTSQSASWRDGIFSRASSQNARLTVSESIQKRPLLLVHEVREMRSDEQLIFVRGRSAIRCGRAVFFRRPEMMAGLGRSRVREGIQQRPRPAANNDTAETNAAFAATIKVLGAVAAADHRPVPTSPSEHPDVTGPQALLADEKATARVVAASEEDRQHDSPTNSTDDVQPPADHKAKPNEGHEGSLRIVHWTYLLDEKTHASTRPRQPLRAQTDKGS